LGPKVTEFDAAAEETLLKSNASKGTKMVQSTLAAAGKFAKSSPSYLLRGSDSAPSVPLVLFSDNGMTMICGLSGPTMTGGPVRQPDHKQR
jgi:hypothetical protein